MQKPRKILIINAHPDPRPSRLAAGLADAYARGATRGGHEVRRIDLGALEFPPIVTGEEFQEPPPPAIRAAQEAVTWSNHITIVFPLWLGMPPALMKSFFEQLCRYEFAFDASHKPMLQGRTARFIVTMIIPNFVFWLLFSKGCKGFARGALWASGIKPTRILPLGNVLKAAKEPWLTRVEELGARGE
jgi:putative NADPH-quinone reductase